MWFIVKNIDFFLNYHQIQFYILPPNICLQTVISLFYPFPEQTMGAAMMTRCF